jgi:hypothetical protein
MPLPSPQEPAGEPKGLPRLGPPPPRNAVEATAAVSSAATGGTRERAPHLSERRAGGRIGAAGTTALQRGVPRLLSYHSK